MSATNGATTRPDTVILLPSTLEEEPVLPPGVRSVRYDPTRPLPDELLDADVLVAWGNGRRQLRDAAARLRRVRWVATLAAGPDTVLEAGFGPDVVVTSGRGLHDGPVAEHTLALVLAVVRRVPALVRAQQEHRWADELGGIQPLRDPEVRTLAGARVLVWGFGSIAARLAPLLAALGAHVTGVARSGGERHGFPVVAQDDVETELGRTDVLVCLLPQTPQTRHTIDAAVLAALPPRAWVVNVGRGTTLDEAALLTAVRSGTVAGAALDVVEREPLDPTSPLWDEPRILLSPHAAGGRPIGAAALLERNLAALLAGRPLENVVER